MATGIAEYVSFDGRPNPHAIGHQDKYCGFAYSRFPFDYMDKFRGYERKAREQNRGLWGKSR